MKRSKLLEIIKEILDEQEGGAVGNVAGALDGGEGPPQVPAAFTAPGQKGPNRATKTMKKYGFTPVKTKKRPYNTEGFDYLDENKQHENITRKI